MLATISDLQDQRTLLGRHCPRGTGRSNAPEDYHGQIEIDRDEPLVNHTPATNHELVYAPFSALDGYY